MTEVKTINDSSSELKISVEVTGEEYQSRFENELSKIAKDVKLDGFRQGKVPLNVIKQKYESQCHQKSIGFLIDFHSQKISNEKKLDLIDTPSAKLLDTPSDKKNLSFELTFNLMPDIDLNQVNDIKLEVPEVDINDADIDKVIKNIQKQNATWIDSTKPASDGNKIVVDYVGKIDGKDFKNNKQNDFTFIINDVIKGDPATVALFKEFSKACLNKNIDDKVEVSSKMPDDFPDKELAGNMVKYGLVIKKILSGKLPSLNKDFFNLLGISTDNEDVFRESVKTHMNFELNDKIVSKKYGIVNEKLLETFSFTLPEALLTKHQNELKQQYASFKKSDENIDDKIKEIASKRVKLNIIYIRLAKEIKNDISDQEAINFCNEQSPSFRQFYAEKLKKDKSSTLLDVKNKMIENSIVEYVIQKSDSSSCKLTFSEVMDE